LGREIGPGEPVEGGGQLNRFGSGHRVLPGVCIISQDAIIG
jgi:hypothetical protein